MHTSYFAFVLWFISFLGCSQFNADQAKVAEEQTPDSILTVFKPNRSIKLSFPRNCFDKKNSPDDYFVDFPTPIAFIKDSIYLINHCNSDALLNIEAIKIILTGNGYMTIGDTLSISGRRYFEFFNFSQMEGWDFEFHQDSKTAILIAKNEQQTTFHSTNNFDDFPPTIQRMISINQTLIYRDENNRINYYFVLYPKEDSLIIQSQKSSVLGLNKGSKQFLTHNGLKNGRISIFHEEKSIILDVSEQLASQSGHFDIWYDQESKRLLFFHWNRKEYIFSIHVFQDLFYDIKDQGSF